MVAVCGQCPGATKAIVWYKFSDGIWRSYKPTTFPFSYEYVAVGGGNYKLSFWKQEPGAQAINPLFEFIEVGSRGQYLGTFNASAAVQPYLYGDLSTLQIVPDSTNRFWQVSGLDACGNRSVYKSLFKGTTGVTTTPLGVYGGAAYSGSRALTDTIYPVSPRPITNLFASCPGCIHVWDKKIFEITGSGIPQLQISCTGNICPPDAVCECDCGAEVCCWNDRGIPIYSYLK
jgi:hypothetical protein